MIGTPRYFSGPRLRLRAWAVVNCAKKRTGNIEMKKLFGATLIASFLAWNLADAKAAESESPIRIVTRHDERLNYDFVIVTSIGDGEIKVVSATANRGNCLERTVGGTPPKTLKYGEGETFVFACNVIELTVETDRGAWTYHPTK
jgi:hypothetical protein